MSDTRTHSEVVSTELEPADGVGSPEVAGPPPYDPAAVGRVAARVAIEAVELVGLRFSRDDGGPLPVPVHKRELEFFAEATWEAPKASILACLVTFAAGPEDGEEGTDDWTLLASYRLLYRLDDAEALNDTDFEQFANWNAVFNAWPYWRELLSSTLAKAGMPPVLAPVLGVPRQ